MPSWPTRLHRLRVAFELSMFIKEEGTSPRTSRRAPIVARMCNAIVYCTSKTGSERPL